MVEEVPEEEPEENIAASAVVESEPKKAEEKPKMEKKETKKATAKVAAAKETKKDAKATKAVSESKPAKATKAAPAKETKAAAKPAEKTAKAAPAKDKNATPAKEAKPAKAAPVKESKPVAAKPAAEKKLEAAKKKGRFEYRKTDKGNYVYKLYAANHKVIATNGGTYSSLSALKAGINSVIKNAKIAPIEDQTLINVEEQKCPKWIIFQDARGEFRFRLLAANGEVVCTPNDGYLSKDACKVGMKSIANTAANADVVKAEE